MALPIIVGGGMAAYRAYKAYKLYKRVQKLKKLKEARDKAERLKKLREAAKKSKKDKKCPTGKCDKKKKKKKKKRDEYLGKTPGKNSRTGREVRERMRREGTLRTRRGRDEFLDESGKWRPADSPQTHMGHHPVDAVDYWNRTGRFLGPKSPAVRRWMLDSKNYRFEWGPLNSARGGATPSRYLPPAN